MAYDERRESRLDQLGRRIGELERIVRQMGPPYLESTEPPCLVDGITPATNPVRCVACPCPRGRPREGGGGADGPTPASR